MIEDTSSFMVLLSCLHVSFPGGYIIQGGPLLVINGVTSSTAQGGGGSFKKRKTIGEIGCCESRMSEQKR